MPGWTLRGLEAVLRRLSQADRLHWPRGALRHTGRIALIGFAREPRPLSCSGAGFSVAAIFVDVSAPRGFGEAAVETARCWRFPTTASHISRSAGMEKLVPEPELQLPR